MGSRSLISLLMILVFFGYSHQRCIHDTLDLKIEELPEEEVNPNRRFLADTFGPLRILPDFTYFTGSDAVKTYLKDKLIPAATDYFAAALRVPQLASLSVSSRTTSICGLATPAVYKSGGVQADLVLFITAETSTASWVAWAGACSVVSSTRRPIFGQVNFNLRDIIPSTDADFENDLVVVMHEITHVLGFSSSLFTKFLNPATVGTKVVNGNTISYVDSPILTQKLRNHFGCSTLVGAYLENQGGSGSAGSHFEKRILVNEYMTASAMADVRISEFTLALLEGSGWYQVNYTMAEAFNWGRGKGCGFLDTPCVNKATKTAAFDEFCSNLASYGCTFDRTLGGYCGTTGTSTSASLDPDFNYWGNNRVMSDNFADNCPYVRPYSNIDCTNPADSSRAMLSTEVYGTGSKCFMGTLFNSGSLKKQYPYCLQYNCEQQSNGAYNLRIIFGSKSAVCQTKGNITVSGYYGNLECPNPTEFCTTVGVRTCKKGCLGRGACQADGTCKCNNGWSGKFCETRLTSNFAKDPKETAPVFNPEDIETPNTEDNESAQDNNN